MRISAIKIRLAGYQPPSSILSQALRYSARPETRHRMWANVLIATGAILPGIGGTATRMGYTEVLYVTELIGLVLTWAGYRLSVRAPAPLALRHDTVYAPVEAEGEAR